MASRTSIYTNALKLPDWVMGGEFGDLSRIMNARDLGYESVAQSEQQTEKDAYALEAQRRLDDMRQALSDQYGNRRPGTMREAYQQLIDAAYEAGDPIKAIDLQGKIDDLNESERQNRLSDLTKAGQIAQMYGPEVASQYFPELSSRVLADTSNRKGRSGGSAGKERSYEMIDDQGRPKLVPESEYNARSDQGWKRNKSSNPLNDMIAEMLQGANVGGLPGEEQVQSQKQTVEDLKTATPGSSAQATRPSGGTPPPPRPGMKWQQNKKTGEFREVPL